MPDISLIQRFCNQAFATVVFEKKSYKRLYCCPRLNLGERKVEKCVIVWTKSVIAFVFGCNKSFKYKDLFWICQMFEFQSLFLGVLEQLLLL